MLEGSYIRPAQATPQVAAEYMNTVGSTNGTEPEG